MRLNLIYLFSRYHIRKIARKMFFSFIFFFFKKEDSVWLLAFMRNSWFLIKKICAWNEFIAFFACVTICRRFFLKCVSVYACKRVFLLRPWNIWRENIRLHNHLFWRLGIGNGGCVCSIASLFYHVTFFYVLLWFFDAVVLVWDDEDLRSKSCEAAHNRKNQLDDEIQSSGLSFLNDIRSLSAIFTWF